MSSIPKRVAERLAAAIKRFHPIIASAQARDLNESDTVTVVTDMLADVFGYDKYAEVTSEHSIRGTFCDLAIRLDGTLQLLIEVKAVDAELKDSYVKQAIDYAANQGVDWVVLTNGEHWRVYKVTFTKPIGQELVLDICFTKLEHRNAAHLELLFPLTKEGWQKSALGEVHERRQALSRFFLGAIVLSEPVLEVVRRELRRISPNVKIGIEEIRNVLVQDVIKREVLEGEKADLARKQSTKAAKASMRAKAEKKASTGSNGDVASEPAEDDEARQCSA